MRLPIFAHSVSIRVCRFFSISSFIIQIKSLSLFKKTLAGRVLLPAGDMQNPLKEKITFLSSGFINAYFTARPIIRKALYNFL
jgi:hypothetical protein